MKVKKQSIESFLEEKICNSGLRTVFGGNPNNGPGSELIPTDDVKDPPPVGGPGGNGITTGSIREGSNP